MERNELISKSKVLVERLGSIDYNALPISDYNKKYITRLRPALQYYMEIYSDCILKGMKSTGLDPEDIILIDYGGGSGFLSMLAKEAGIGQVIYIDLNPLSVETIKVLKEHTGIGPDIILPGSSDALVDWCSACRLKPHLLIATDLIEHIYNLSDFFRDLHKVNQSMQMIFTTASTPYNPIVKRRLHKFMKECETGSLMSPNYYTRREEFIKMHCPDLTHEQLIVWAHCTRGLIYDDILRAIQNNKLPIPEDKYNTCDPETGNWTERILPIKDYRTLLFPYGYRLEVGKGYYNTYRSNHITRLISKCIKGLIRISGRVGLFIAPFIFLIITPQSSHTGK